MFFVKIGNTQNCEAYRNFSSQKSSSKVEFVEGETGTGKTYNIIKRAKNYFSEKNAPIFQLLLQ